MIVISEDSELKEQRDQISEIFLTRKNDKRYLEDLYSSIGTINDWRYSTGPVFDQPPYTLEMAGFDTGRLLKKNYPSPFDARANGVYSSGFINDRHIVTIDPCKTTNGPLSATFFTEDGGDLLIVVAKFFDREFCAVTKPPELVSVKKFYTYRENIKACVGVGARNAYTIRLYYCDNEGKIVSASMVSAPYDLQANYKMEYDSNNELVSISSGKKFGSARVGSERHGIVVYRSILTDRPFV